MSQRVAIAGPLWRDRAFALFWLGRAISLTGTGITSVVLPVLVYRITGSPLLTALLTSIEVAPYLIFGLVAGALADRVDRRRLMIASDLANMLLLGSIPVAAVAGLLSVAQVMLVALLSATAYVWFDAAYFGALPVLVGHECIVTANSAISSMSTVVQIAAPALGGVLIATFGPPRAISFDASSYLISVASLALLPRALSTLAAPGGVPRSLARRTLDDIREGVAYLWHQRLVRALTLLGFGNSVVGGAASGLLVVYAVRALRLAPTDARIGLLYAAGGVGALPPALLLPWLLLPWLLRRLPADHVTLGALLANALLLAALAVATPYALALVALALWEAAYALITLSGISLRQVVTPDHLQSRVNATARMIAWGGTPFGAAAGGVLASALPVRQVYLLMAGAELLCLLAGWLSPLRERVMASALALQPPPARAGTDGG